MLIPTAHAGIISDAPRFAEIGMSTLDVLLSVAAIIAIVTLVFAGILYITSGGNEDRIETAKKALVGSVIGLVIVLLALVISTTVTQLV